MRTGLGLFVLLQTLPYSYVPEDRSQVGMQYAYGHYIVTIYCTYTHESPVEIQCTTHWNPIGRGVTALPPVIAQQYSSATSVTLRVPSRKEKFGALLIMLFHVSYLFKNCVNLQFCIYVARKILLGTLRHR